MFYEIVKFIINNYNYYCIWFSNEDTEGFITESNKLVIYNTGLYIEICGKDI